MREVPIYTSAGGTGGKAQLYPSNYMHLCGHSNCNTAQAEMVNLQACLVMCGVLCVVNGQASVRPSPKVEKFLDKLASEVDPENPPTGHLQRFGSWKPAQQVETREEGDLPDVQEFFDKYVYPKGKPVIFKGAAKTFAAYSWNDKDLSEKFGEDTMSLEYNKKETRTGGGTQMTFNEFLQTYNDTDTYCVNVLREEGPRSGVGLLPFLRCGGYHERFTVSNMWMSR